MKYQLTQEQFKNLHEAVKFWLKVPRETVRSGLDKWRDNFGYIPDIAVKPDCGSTACFGGWLPYAPYFRALGVEPKGEEDGIIFTYPVLRINGHEVSKSKCLAERLFGERELFASAFYWGVDRQFKRELGDNYSDWGLVLMRLAYVLENADLKQ